MSLANALRPPTRGRSRLVSTRTGPASASANRSLKRSASDFGAISQKIRTTIDSTMVPIACGTLSRYESMSNAVHVETTITATVFRVRIVERYALGSACRRVTVFARRLPSSARLRIRIRLTLVSEVSAAAANAAITRPATMTTMSGIIGAVSR